MRGTHPPAPRCVTAAALADALPIEDPDRVARARTEAASRPIDYPLGSGQAEEIALFAGLKPAIRQSLDPAQQAILRQRFTRLGLAVVDSVDTWAHAAASREHDDRYVHRSVLIAGRDLTHVQQIAACERRLREARIARATLDAADIARIRGAIREEGRLLGYPRCCVEAFSGAPCDHGNPPMLRATLARTRGAPRPRLNVLDLAVFHYLPWLPCAFDCDLSTRYADAVAARIQARYPAFVSRIDEALAAHRLLALEDVQISILGHVEGRRAIVHRAWPTARDRHPDAGLEPPALEAAARLTALIEARGSVEIEGDTIVAGDEPLARCRDALLLAFA